MRKLHLVGLTADRQGLMFTARSGSKAGGYLVPIDSKLLDALAAAGGAPPPASATEEDEVEVEAAAPVAGPGKAQSALTPREIQARLRAGRSLEEVAEEAGVGVEWIERFAVPIIAEQARVVAMGRNLVYSKPRLGESSQPLAASVAWNLSERSVWLGDELFESSWGAYQLHDSVWILRFRYRSRGRQQDALWELELDTGRLLARNRLAADLGYVEKGRRRRDAAESVDDDMSPQATPRRKATARAAPAKARTSPTAAPGAAAAKASPTRKPASKAAPKPAPAKAHASKAAAPKAAATGARATKASAPRAPAAGARAAKTAAPGAEAKPTKRAEGRSTTARTPRPKSGSTSVANSTGPGRGRAVAPPSGAGSAQSPSDDLDEGDLSELAGPAPRFTPRPMPSDGVPPRRPQRPRRSPRPPKADNNSDAAAGEVVKLPSSRRSRSVRRSP